MRVVRAHMTRKKVTPMFAVPVMFIRRMNSGYVDHAESVEVSDSYISGTTLPFSFKPVIATISRTPGKRKMKGGTTFTLYGYCALEFYPRVPDTYTHACSELGEKRPFDEYLASLLRLRLKFSFGAYPDEVKEIHCKNAVLLK